MKILPIMVFKDEYYLIDENPKERNIEFLKNIQPKYMLEMANTLNDFLKSSNKDDKDYIAVQIRAIYGQALETFFAFSFALLQAPFSMVGWLQHYSVNKLMNMIKILLEKKDFEYFKIGLKGEGWYGFSKTINMFNYEDEEEYLKIINGFSEFWMSLSRDFIDPKLYKEYCSIKHGFRIEHGGFKLLLGRNDEKRDMLKMGDSRYGSKIHLSTSIHKAKNNPSAFSLRRTFFNWDIEYLIKRIELLSYSLTNIISFAIGMNIGNLKDQKFEIPDDLSLFHEAIVPNSGIINMDIDINYNKDEIPIIKKNEIKEYYEDKLFFLENK